MRLCTCVRESEKKKKKKKTLSLKYPEYYHNSLLLFCILVSKTRFVLFQMIKCISYL